MCEMRAIVQSCEHSFALPFFGIGMNTDLFQSCGHCWDFQICWHFECSTLFFECRFLSSSFRIWNSSTGIPSPALALFAVMLPKAHLTSHSRMSGFRSVITPLWFSGSWRSFFYSSSVYFCHLLISSASVGSISFMSFIVPIFAWNIPLYLFISNISLNFHPSYSLLTHFLYLLAKVFLDPSIIDSSLGFYSSTLSMLYLHFGSLITGENGNSKDISGVGSIGEVL